ncbi:MAG: DUF4878 domain-containing protein [Bacteroidales bacterium]|jgi:hypothetical protein|nr:DUF4878 domain-containing protein [Bacteroidales bacterium]NLX41814.1 DUF4878 domain-containing protein [Bacteroidales bacterium]
MRKIGVLFAFAIIMTLFASCENAEEKVTTVADGFLKSYYQMDYEDAATYCTDEFAEILLQAVASRPELPETLAELVEVAAKATTYTILKVDTESVEDEATVSFELLPYKSEVALERTLFLIKSDREWKVSDFK